MSLRWLLLFFGVAHSFALLSKDLQSFVNIKLMPSDLMKMKAVDPNWRGEGIFEIIAKVAGLFVHKETNEIILESMLEPKEKLWTESEIIKKLRYRSDEFKNLIETKDWNKLFNRYLHTDQFKKYWREALAEVVDMNKYEDDEIVQMMGDDPKVVKILLERGAKVNATDKYGWTALHYAAYYGEIKLIKLLLKFKANINATDNSDETPLMTAVKRTGNKKENLWSVDVVNLLLEHGARLNLKNKHGRTALHLAAYYGSIRAIELLLEFDAEINATDKSEETALMQAVRKSSVDAVKVLLKRRARLDIKNEHGKTAFDIANFNRDRNDIQNEKIIKLLEPDEKQIIKKNENSGCEKCLII